MEKAILYKEWLKTHRVFWALLTLAVVTAAYAILRMNSLITLKGVDHLWIVMLAKDNMFIDFIKYVPALSGIGLAVAQMVPEMSHRRLKLTLHLPCPQGRLVALMLLTGVVELLLICMVQAAMIAVYDLSIITPEMTARVLLTALPWFMAGFAAYFMVCAICLEGTWMRRILLGLLGIAILLMFFLGADPEMYNGSIIFFLLIIAATAVLPFGSVSRFKEGRQD